MMTLDLLLFAPPLLLVLILGSAIGSFLNVVVYRLPQGLSLIHPASRCPSCLTPLRKRDNLPIFGWLHLRGRCHHCRRTISVRYPLVELGTGLLFGVTFASFGYSIVTLGYWIFLSWLVALALIDLDTLTLPNVLTRSGVVLGLGFQGIVGITQTNSLTGGIQSLILGLLGAIVGIWLLHLLSFIGSLVFGQEAMGAGDAKLASMLGAWLGWQQFLMAGFFACGCGAVVGMGAMALGRLSRRQPMPFGPFLALGGLFALFWGNALLSAYTRFLLPAA